MEILTAVLPFVVIITVTLSAPFPHKWEQTQDYNYTSSYIQFFKVQELIEKVNIEKFKEYQQGVEPTDAPSTISSDETVPDDVTSGVNTLEIDLTDEAIINDKVTNVQPIEIIETVTVLPEVVAETTITFLDEEDSNEEQITNGENIQEKITDIVEETSEDLDSSEVPSTFVSAEEDVLLNTIDTGTETFVVSGDTVDAAKRFGYKILLKKVGSEEVAVGKIKFTLPTTVEIEPVDDIPEVVNEEEVTSIASISTKDELTTVPSIEIIEEVTTIAAMATEEEVTTIGSKAAEEVTEVASETTDASESVDTKESATEASEYTTPSSYYLPPPIAAVLPTIDVLDEETIIEGVMQVEEDTKIAVAEIESHHEINDVIVFPTCNVSVSEVKEILSNLASSVSTSAPLIADILSTGQELRLETDTWTLARGGAKLLTLLEPFLDSLLPHTKVPSCAGSSSTTMLMSLSGVATQLDIIATNEVDQEKADQLHRSATSLQLAAWVMAQLQASIHTFYDPEALCEEGTSSTVEILGALSKAISGYIPVIGVMGSEVALEELRETVARLDSAKDEITGLLDRSELASLPGVECGANFSVLAEQLEILADFLQAIPVQ